MSPSKSKNTVFDTVGLLQDARRRLLETGTRNRLVHVNRSNTQANALEVINETSSELYRLLRVERRSMRFVAKGYDLAKDDVLLLDYHHDEAPYTRPTSKTSRTIQTPVGPKLLNHRLTQLRRNSVTAEEERGVSILYLALGFLTWVEPQSPPIPREAPLVLLPVTLTETTRGLLQISIREDELVTNLPLQARLLSEFKVSLPDIDETAVWTPEAYFDCIDALIQDRPGWSLDRNGIQLGLFSFAKFLMLRDLDPRNWPYDALTTHPLLTTLLSGSLDDGGSDLDAGRRLDQMLDPGDLFHVVDADASQAKVIEDVRAGRNLLVQGPPGTGKSQTIVNILAAAAQDGKTVLFIAEKMAALSVVHERMKHAGLSDLCIELHSNKTSKRLFWQEIARTLTATRDVRSTDSPPDALRTARDRLNAIDATLHSTISGADYTPYQVLADQIGFSGKQTRPARIDKTGLDALSLAQASERGAAVRLFADIAAHSGLPAAHPFCGCRNVNLQPADVERLRGEIESAEQALAQMHESLCKFREFDAAAQIETLGDATRCADVLAMLECVPQGFGEFAEALLDARSQPRLQQSLDAGLQWQACETGLEGKFLEHAWETSLRRMYPALKRGTASFLSRQFLGYRLASYKLAALLQGTLPKSAPERLDLANALLLAQKKRTAYLEGEAFLKSILKEHWRGARTEFGRISDVAAWLATLHATGQSPELDALKSHAAAPGALPLSAKSLRSRIDAATCAVTTVRDRLNLDLAEAFGCQTLSDVTLTQIQDHIARLFQQSSRYPEWVARLRAAGTLDAFGLMDLRERVDQNDIAPQDAENEFGYALAEARWERAISTTPALKEIRFNDRHALVELFGNLETRRRQEVRQLIRTAHLAQVPRGDAGPMGIVRLECSKKNGNAALRRVFEATNGIVQRIKPVFLMSPISLAQFIPPGDMSFDLLVIDEASQIRPEDALGAVARARQLVVVGDQKQLPPTNFFERLSAEVDDDQTTVYTGARATEMESILSLCEARAMPSRILEWHYRSRDPSLITVSNREFYDNRLIVPPAPLLDRAKFGMSFVKVPGAYTGRGNVSERASTNRVEADAIARELAAHARTSPHLSIGAVAFSLAQKNLLEDVVDMARRTDHILDAFINQQTHECVFFKNIESVQGDERDVILISVGYGPTEPGGPLTRMTFGPVNAEGGERRLNVLFSRARVRCKVFASFEPNDIDISRSSNPGPAVLREYLRFAQSGNQVPTKASDHAPTDNVVQDIGRAIVALGYDVDFGIGTDTFRIDIGVRRAGELEHYLLAVECDGHRYHTYEWARERDRLRQDTLQNMGWNHHRIWAMDWFYSREQEVERLRIILNERQGAEAATDLPLAPPMRIESAQPAPMDPSPDEPEVLYGEIMDLSLVAIEVPAYQQADFAIPYEVTPHELPLNELQRIVTKIVAVEGPVHGSEVARRLAGLFGSLRTTPRIFEATIAALTAPPAGGGEALEQDEEGFWQTRAQHLDPPIRNRSEITGSLRDASNLPGSEIRAAAKLLIRECGTLGEQDLSQQISILLGFKRLGPSLKQRIVQALGAK